MIVVNYLAQYLCGIDRAQYPPCSLGHEMGMSKLVYWAVSQITIEFIMTGIKTLFLTNTCVTLLALHHLAHFGTCLGGVLLALHRLANLGTVIGGVLLALLRLAHFGTCLGGVLLARHRLANLGTVISGEPCPSSPRYFWHMSRWSAPCPSSPR